MRAFVLYFALLLSCAGCKTTAEQPADQVALQMEDGIPATVRYIELEGGFYGIEGDDGESYYPVNLEDEFKEDGLRIVFTMKPRTDVMTTVMWGKTVEILEIQRM